MSALAELKQKLDALSERERVALLIVALVLGVLLVVMVGIRPAWNTLQQGPKRLAALDLQHDALQRGLVEVQALRNIPPVAPQQAQEALQAATRFLGEQAVLTMQGDRATLKVTQATGEALVRWLGEVRQGARARAVEAQLQRSGNGYAGTVVLSLGAGT